VGLEKLWLCGITGIPPDNQISKTALGAEKVMPWEYTRTALECLKRLKEQQYQIVLLEQTVHSVPYEEFVPKGPVCLVVGNEIGGVSDELLPLCDAAVEIDMAGLKNSLNVTVAFGVVAYHFRQQLKKVLA
jgi:23S rRNA (guanosine2251-2'-O)-methyltransferase